MMLKKFGVLKTKVSEMNEFTEHFHTTTDKLEKLYGEDIEFRKKYYQDHTVVKSALGSDGVESGYDLSQINEIFDEIEAEEKKSLPSMIMTPSNLSLVAVILVAAYVYQSVDKLGRKQRFD